MNYVDDIDFSENALIEMYNHETHGNKIQIKFNGYKIGKSVMNITISMWREDINKNMLFIEEIEKEYPEWFLNKFLKINKGK